MISKPIIILGAPRSGTTILQRCLALHPDIWHLPGESHAILEGPFHPRQSEYESNRVTADDVNEGVAEQLRRRFYRLAINLNTVWATPAPLLAANTLSERAFSKPTQDACATAHDSLTNAGVRPLDAIDRRLLSLITLSSCSTAERRTK
jgi:hypothetical protein